MAVSPPSCLLVIPSYRDSARLEPFLRELVAELPPEFTVQVVDDGSGPEEAARLRRVLANLPAGRATVAEPIWQQPNRGKGAAVRAGWARAGEFDLAAFVDADGSVCAREIVRGYGFLRDHADTLDGLLGSRLRVLGHTVKRRFVRHACGRVFATAVTMLTGLPVYDTQCGFKLVKSEWLLRVLPGLDSDRFAFDVELIVELRRAGARLREFPVDWTHRSGSKVAVWREMLPMLFEVWRVSRRRPAAG